MAEARLEGIRAGAVVRCTDGRVGQVAGVGAAADDRPGSLRVVRESDGRELRVPIDLVEEVADDGSVLLGCAGRDLDRLGTSVPGEQRLGVGGAPSGERMQLREEELVPHKEMREAGRVRIRKEVEEVPRVLDVEAAREQVAVEHVPVGKVVPEKRAPWREGDFLIVPVYEEQVEVVKRLVLREQLRIRLETTTEARRIAESVLRERVVIEDSTDKGFVREYYATPPEDHPTAQ
jgi:uncharacterized protein (TIGR02271 family)